MTEPTDDVPISGAPTDDLPTAQPTASDPLPSLSEHDDYRPQAKAVKATQPVVDTSAASETGLAAKMRSRRRRRARIKRAISLLVLFGLLGGGAYAAKYYLLDVRWTDGYEALATEVETARGLSFDEPIEVKELDAAEYGTKLFRSTMHIDAAGEAELAGEWRALGVLTGALDSSTLGLTAAVESPAFFDPGSSTIYVIRELPTELHRFAIQRALAMALLDQEFGWGGRESDLAAAAEHGTTMLFDADALAIAESLLDTDERVALLAQQRTLATAFNVTTSSSPFASALMGRPGLALRSYVQGLDLADRTAIELGATILDGQALDLRRLVVAVAAVGSNGGMAPDVEVGPDALGALYWYHVLATRLDADTAWRTALALRSDSVSVVSGSAGVCATALLRFDPATVDGADAALATWAAGAPLESSTTASGVAGGEPGEFEISACDPGDAVDTRASTPRPSLGGAMLRSEQFRVLRAARPELTDPRVACAVFGADPISVADDRPLLDGLEAWVAPSTHPAPDPDRADCLTL